MKKAEITRQFTDIVEKYIRKGYNFSVTMSGHQGEEMKVDLENGVNTVRIRLDRFSNWELAPGLKIVVEQFDKVAYDTFTTLWNGKGTELYSCTFYNVDRYGDSDDGWYTTDEVTVKQLRNLSYTRRKNRELEDTVKYTQGEAIRIAYVWLKKQPKCKTKTVKDISYVSKTNNNRWYVTLTNNKTMRIA